MGNGLSDSPKGSELKTKSAMLQHRPDSKVGGKECQSYFQFRYPNWLALADGIFHNKVSSF